MLRTKLTKISILRNKGEKLYVEWQEIGFLDFYSRNLDIYEKSIVR